MNACGLNRYREETMPPTRKSQPEQELKDWPQHWPPPCKFLGPLIFNITSFSFRSSLTEHQAIIRFKNRYGIKISENFFHEGLFLVDILKFHGSNDDDYVLVHHSPLPDLTWYANSSEIFTLSEKVAQWERQPGSAMDRRRQGSP
jgi:hypothetical protein